MRPLIKHTVLAALFLLLGFSVVPAPALAAASGRITGKITDKSTGEALPGANVVIKGTTNGTASDLDGLYSIPNAPAGELTLVITYVGYKTEERQVRVVDGQTVRMDIALEWQGVEGEEVIITAQAQGQVAAINQQLQSNTIANIVSRDRIQELPDVNAAESIGRLPGISIQRSGGEANKIAIRGLSPKYNTVTVNGVRVPATGGDDRSIDLSLISSNMLDGIEVRKAITPDMDADAIAGSVDLRLRNAPDGLMVDVQAQGGYNQLQDNYGNYKISGTVSNRFFANRLGIIGTFNTDGYDRSADIFNGNYDQSTNAATQESEILIGSLNLREQNIDRGRIGSSVLVDYNIPGGRISGNAFYNKLTDESLNRINQLFNATNGRHYYNLEETESNTDILTAALSSEQDFGWIKYDAGVSWSRSTANSPRDYLYTFVQEGNAYSPFTRVPGMDPREVIQYITLDSLTTGFSDAYFRSIDREENNSAVQLNLTVPYRLGNSITGHVKSGGKLRWLDRSNDVEQEGANGMHYGLSSSTRWLDCVDQQFADGVNGYGFAEEALNRGMVTMYMFGDHYARSNFLEGDYPLGYTANPELAKQFAMAMSNCPGAFLERVNDSRGQDYTGDEKYQAGYIMTELNLGRHITLIPGIRWEGDQSKYIGQQYREAVVNNQQAAPTDLDTLIAERDNSFWLPMLHLQIKPLNWLQIRLARTETLARPDFNQYVPITHIDSQLQYASAGNAQLKPSQSTNYDASVSVYENKIGLFTVSAFHKTIKDHIRWIRFVTTNDDPLPDYLNVPESWLVNNPYVDTYINNPDDAHYKGFEVDWQTNFWYLPSVLKGVVLNVNYTRILSDTKYRSFELERVCTNCPSPRPRYTFRSVPIVRDGRMVDQPAHIANVTLGYDYKGFSARLSYLYQTNRVNNINATTPVLDTFTGDYTRYDLSVRQKLPSGFELFTNFNNLTDTKDRSFQQEANSGSPTYIEHYGFTMDIGARYRF